MKIPYLKLILLALILVLFSNTTYAAEKYYAVLQFKDPNTGLVQIVFQRCDSRWLANKLNEGHWNGVKTTCPQCIKEIDSCVQQIPSSFEGIFENRQIIFPYLSSKEDRIIYLGVPMEDAIRLAKWMENGYKTKLNRPAKAIMPLTLNE